MNIEHYSEQWLYLYDIELHVAVLTLKSDFFVFYKLFCVF